jgi:hypothetical protein
MRVSPHGAYLRMALIQQLGRYPVRVAQANGSLLHLWNGVLVDSKRALEIPTRAEAALLLHPPQSAVAGPTAAWLHGCTAAPTGDIHVMTPYETRSRSRSGLIVHNGSLCDEDVTEVAGLRVLTRERTIVDVLCTARPRDAIAVADQMLALYPDERREHFRARLAERLRRRPDPRGTKRAARMLGLATGKAESPPESWLLYEVVNWRFPAPEANWPVRTPDGAPLYRLDLAWPFLRIALEYNGYAVHAGREIEDAHRAEELRRLGWIVIVATAADLSDGSRLCHELRKAFADRGHSVRDR